MILLTDRDARELNGCGVPETIRCRGNRAVQTGTERRAARAALLVGEGPANLSFSIVEILDDHQDILERHTGCIDYRDVHTRSLTCADTEKNRAKESHKAVHLPRTAAISHATSVTSAP